MFEFWNSSFDARYLILDLIMFRFWFSIFYSHFPIWFVICFFLSFEFDFDLQYQFDCQCFLQFLIFSFWFAVFELKIAILLKFWFSSFGFEVWFMNSIFILMFDFQILSSCNFNFSLIVILLSAILGFWSLNFGCWSLSFEFGEPAHMRQKHCSLTLTRLMWTMFGMDAWTFVCVFDAMLVHF